MSEILGTLFKYLMMALGVAAVVYILYETFADNKTSNDVSDVTTIASQITGDYSGTSDYSSLGSITPQTLVTDKLVPSSMWNGSSLVNPWGGSVSVTADSNPAWFDVTQTGLSSGGCSGVAKAVTGYETLSINGSQVGTSIAPATPAAIDNACGASSSNTLTFAF